MERVACRRILRSVFGASVSPACTGIVTRPVPSGRR
jgi:hypothetical protein